MATSELLTKPTIIEVTGSTFRIAHPDISGNVRTYLASTIAAAGTAMTVLDNNGFADDDWYVIGDIGDEKTESGDVNGAVTVGSSMTVTNNLSFAHEVNAPVTKINERGIAIYGAATDGGAGTLIASIDAKTASGKNLADAVMIQWDKPYTEYTLITTDTTYAYYYAKFTDGITSSASSDYVLAAGLASNSVEYFIQQALTLTNSELDDALLKRERLVKVANDCQSAIAQFKYQDPRTGEYTQTNWEFEMVEDKTSLTLSTGEHEYALSGLSVAPKWESERAIISIRIGSEGKIEKQLISEYDDDTEEHTRTDCATTGAVAATSLVVDSNVEFTDTGTLYSGDNTLTYTGKTGTTTFTGIPASGDYSIETQIEVDDPVWQGIQLDLPTKYSYFDGKIIFNKPPASDYSGYPIKLRYFKKLPALLDASDVTEVTFSNVFELYLASWIERRKGNEDKAIQYMKEFKDQVLNNALSASVPTIDEISYYQFNDDC